MASPGRPRDRAKDEAILEAARELVAEVGYQRLTMESVATRAGVSKPTLYLRYPSRSVLVLDAIFGQTRSRELPSTDDLRADLREAYGWLIEEFGSPGAREALPGLLAELGAAGRSTGDVRRHVVDAEYRRVRDRLAQAREDGEIYADADLDLLVDAFIGTALARVLLLDHGLDRSFGDRLVDVLLDGVRTPDVKRARRDSNPKPSDP